MTDHDDLIRREDALDVCRSQATGYDIAQDIAALPAVGKPLGGDHADLIARLRNPGFDASEEAADAIEALVAERDALDDQLTRATVARAQETIRAGQAEAKLDAAHALLRGLRDKIEELVDTGDVFELEVTLGRIDALLAGKEPTE